MLEALGWIKNHARAQSALSAIPALEKCIEAHPDEIVRNQAAFTLGIVAETHKKPCPLALVKALFDDDEYVRQTAGCMADHFESFEPGCLETLLRCVESERVDVRVHAVSLLVAAGPKDKRVVAALKKALRDESFNVRNNARSALFRATDSLEEYLRYLIRLREEPDAMLDPVPKDKELRGRELSVRNLVLFAMVAFRVPEWSEKRPEELARLLMKFLDDRSPSMRRGAARVIACCAWKFADSADHDEAFRRFLPDEKVEVRDMKKSEPKKPSEKSKVALHLEKLKVRERLVQLRDTDADASVRAVCAEALESLNRGQQKKPNKEPSGS